MTAAIRALSDQDCTEAFKAYRKSMIGRGKELRARDFDDAIHGVEKATAGKLESLQDLLVRTLWYSKHDIQPVVVRPVGWEWQPEEMVTIRIARVRQEPRFLAFDPVGIEEVNGPVTKPNPWDKWR